MAHLDEVFLVHDTGRKWWRGWIKPDVNGDGWKVRVRFGATGTSGQVRTVATFDDYHSAAVELDLRAASKRGRGYSEPDQ